jgi:fluoroacetyl-CoA thioesterase
MKLPDATGSADTQSRAEESRLADEAVERRMPLGLEASIERVVPREWTIAIYDPRLPPVFSTPAMIGMMEVAAANSLLSELPPGVISLGTRIEVDHLKAVHEGATVRATARLVAYQGRFLVFDVEARCGELLLGRGKVFRAIVQNKKFQVPSKEK